MRYERLCEIPIRVWASVVIWKLADPRGHLPRFLHPDIATLPNPHTWLNFQDCHNLVIGKTTQKSIYSCVMRNNFMNA